jgi:hypothetical protein
MKLADLVLRCLVRRRDRLTISGDLLEAYQDEILPARGRAGARVWYVRQILSFISPTGWAVLIGAALHTWILIATTVAPLADDSGYEMLIWFAGIVCVATAVSIRDAKHFGFSRGVWSGVSFGAAFGAIGYFGALIRVNLFLEQIRDRTDWAGLVGRFHASGFTNFRAFVNYEYAFSLPFLLAAGAVLGAVGGGIAGLLSRPRRAVTS